MKIYTTLVSILLFILLAYYAISYGVKTTYEAQQIAVFNDSYNRPKMFQLKYSENGDLTFSTTKLQHKIPSITHWDYYGSTELVSYNWLNQNTIAIEMKDSKIKIVIPNFIITVK